MARAAVAALTALLCAALLPSDAHAQKADPLRLIKLPKGFSIELYARVPKARTMVLKEDWGVTLVGSRGPIVHAVLDSNKDGRANAIGAIFEDLKLGNGIAWKDGWFYIAEQHRLVRYKAPNINTLAQAKPQVLFDKFPDNSWHGWRYARFGPDGKLYVAIGAPCNICLTNGLEGTIVRFNPTAGPGTIAPGMLTPEIFATGVRNSVGFDFHPTTGDLYFTDNGADNMGDDSPPDEFNHAPQKDMWFGFPWFGGGCDRTPDFKGKPVPRPATFPVINFGAHVASLGISFYTGDHYDFIDGQRHHLW